MQWKSLPEKVVTRFWKRKRKNAETESQNQGEKDGLVGIAVSYDMGWQKRGGRVTTPSQLMVRQWGL